MKNALAAVALLSWACTTNVKAPAPPTPASTPAAVAAPTPAIALLTHASLEFDRANLDTSVNACSDFFEYANGGWLKSHPIPPQYQSWGIASGLAVDNRRVIREVLEDAAAKDPSQRTSNQQKIGDYWTSCMDEAGADRAGIAPLSAEIQRIDAISSQRDLQAEVARLQSMGIPVLFSLHSVQDAKNSTEVIAEIYQAGLGLPDRDYYLRTDEKSVRLREQYVEHIAALLRLSGVSEPAAAAQAAAVLKLETSLAKVSMTRVEERDPDAGYNRMTVATLATIAPSFDWSAYFAGRQLPGITTLNVAQPAFIKGASGEVKATPIADWKAYLRWHLLDATAPALSSPFVSEDFHFREQTLRGQKEIQDRWQRCAIRADQQLGEALGEAWVARKFSPEAKRKAVEMVQNLIDVLGSEIPTLDWMSPATRREAIEKLGTFVKKVGYPDKWRDYSALEITRGPDVQNFLAAATFETSRDLAKIGKPVDRTEWGMTPPTLNAYYDPSLNEIVFPAGFLQWPMFDVSQDDAFNYGGIGGIIGHEITHGFDDQGSKFDSKGNLRNWWTEEDRKRFDARAECIVKQFDSYEIEPGLHHNGRLVAGESIADLGGSVLAYAAWKHSLEGKPKPPVIDGFTPEQRFFLGMARKSATNTTPEALRLRVQSNPHPANKFRINGPLSNMPEFASAFQCKAGDPMVRQDRCVIW